MLLTSKKTAISLLLLESDFQPYPTVPKTTPNVSGPSLSDAQTGRSKSNLSTNALHREDDKYTTGDQLSRYGGYVTGFAETFAGALRASRAEIIDAVDGADPEVDTFMVINGNRGTDSPGGSTNRIQSEDHDRDGVDRVFIGVTLDQFEQLGEVVGADVSIR